MAKANRTIKQTMQYPQQYAAWFSATQTLFNQVASFYFQVIQAHEKVLSLSSQKALNALETLTHATDQNPYPVMPLDAIAPNLPGLFRRAALHAALGSARSFSTTLNQWRGRKAVAEAKKKRFTERPPVPPRTWNRSETLYAGQWKQRTKTHIVLKLWTGTCWSWVKVHLLSRQIPQEKPSTPLLLAAERDEKSSGVPISHDADSVGGPFISRARRQGSGNGHGTAHEECAGMVAHLGSIPRQLRLFSE